MQLKMSFLVIFIMVLTLATASPALANCPGGPDCEGALSTQGVTDGYFPNPSTTLAKLSSFTTKADDGQVTITWITASELDNQGFNLWRGSSADGEYQKVNELMISARGAGPSGAEYEYVDQGLKNGAAYYYKLEDVDNQGVSTWHGPITAIPNFAISPSEPKTAPVVGTQPAVSNNKGEIMAPGAVEPGNDVVLPTTIDWISGGDYKYKVQFSTNPSFPKDNKETLTLPAKRWLKTTGKEPGVSFTPDSSARSAVLKLAEPGEPVYVSIMGRDRWGNINYSEPLTYELPTPWYRSVVGPASAIAIAILGFVSILRLVAFFNKRRGIYMPQGAAE